MSVLHSLEKGLNILASALAVVIAMESASTCRGCFSRNRNMMSAMSMRAYASTQQ